MDLDQYLEKMNTNTNVIWILKTYRIFSWKSVEKVQYIAPKHYICALFDLIYMKIPFLGGFQVNSPQFHTPNDTLVAKL